MSASDESKPVPPPESNPILGFWIIITRILALGSILPWGGLAFCSLLSHPSDKWTLERILFLGTFYFYPLIIVGMVYFTRVAFKKGWLWVAWTASTVSILPLIWLLLEFTNII